MKTGLESTLFMPPYNAVEEGHLGGSALPMPALPLSLSPSVAKKLHALDLAARASSPANQNGVQHAKAGFSVESTHQNRGLAGLTANGDMVNGYRENLAQPTNLEAAIQVESQRYHVENGNYYNGAVRAKEAVGPMQHITVHFDGLGKSKEEKTTNENAGKSLPRSCECKTSSSIFNDRALTLLNEGVAYSGSRAAIAAPVIRTADGVHHTGHSMYFVDEHRGVTLHYRLYGHSNAAQKVFFIMGLATQASAWQLQVEYFSNYKDYQLCIFDNRGVGKSSKPLGRYTTSSMAEDAACLMEHLGWNSYRSVHVVGTSMGGMIAQEVALLVPERILSLSLLCTFAGGLTTRSLPKMSGAAKFVATAVGFALGEQVHTESLMRFLFTDDSIRSDGERLRDHIREAKQDGYSVVGSTLQYAAVLTHHCSPQQLKRIRFQPFKKLVVTGSHDDIVHPRNSHWLARNLGVELVVIEGTGHGILAEKPEQMNHTLHRHFVESFEHFKRTHIPVHVRHHENGSVED